MSEMKQILLTGISSALGGVLAKYLAAESDTHIIATMRQERSSSFPVSANIDVVDRCDLTQSSCCSLLAQVVNDRFSGPFGFVHSVGNFWEHVPFLEFEADDARRMFDSHVMTLYTVLQELIPVMKAKGGASTIAFSCNSVRYHYPWMAPFTASKSAVDSLVQSLANEFAGDGLRFNSLVLASLRTERVRQSKPQGDYASFIPPEDIVPVVRFLLSDEAYLVNGNGIQLFKHSERFYQTGYFERISK